MTTTPKLAILTAALFTATTLPISRAATPTTPRPANARVSMLTNIPELKADALPLEKVLNYLRTTANTNLVINWKVLESANVTKDTPITLNLANIPLRKALRLILDQASPQKFLVFSVDSNVISITTQEEADKVLLTRVYVIDDLIMTDNDPVNPPTMDLSQVTKSGTTSGGASSSSGGGGIFSDSGSSQNSSTQQTPEKRGDDIVKLITSVVRPEIWRDNGGTATIRYFNGKLIVTAPQSVQEAIGGPTLPEGGQSLATH